MDSLALLFNCYLLEYFKSFLILDSLCRLGKLTCHFKYISVHFKSPLSFENPEIGLHIIFLPLGLMANLPNLVMTISFSLNVWPSFSRSQMINSVVFIITTIAAIITIIIKIDLQ